MKPATSHKPDYAHAVSPHLVCAGAAKAIDYYKAAFGADEVMRIAGPDGRLMHACLKINGSTVMLVDEIPEMGALGPATLKMSPVTIHLFVPDVDAVMQRAAAAGGKIAMPAQDMMWGDRYGVVVDPFGHRWSIATHKIDMSPAELQSAMDEAIAKRRSDAPGCANTETSSRDFRVTRDLAAPRALVWSLFTELEHLKKWWGPKGFEFVSATLDLKPGGRFHYGMRTPKGEVMWGLFNYRDISAPERLDFVNGFSDAEGGMTRHPMAPVWPLKMFSRFEFTDIGNGRTRFSATSHPIEATPEEQKAFENAAAGMEAGWAGTMQQLEAYIEQVTQGGKA